jgi:sugar lactone lactonase YvrE
MRRMWPDAELPVPADPGGDLRAAAGRDVLGECPLWDDARGVLWWIDIRAPALRCLRPLAPSTRAVQVSVQGQAPGSLAKLTPGEVHSWTLPHLVGSIALTDDPQGRLLMALGRHFVLFDPQAVDPAQAGQATGSSSELPAVGQRAGAFETLIEVDFQDADHRFNDGRCDPAGRFWVGSMNNITRGPEGRMFRYDAALGLVEFAQLAPGLRIPNSLAFSPDGRTMYFADSLDHAIRAFTYDPATGQPVAARAFADMAPPAFPDGSCVDTEGGLWNTRFHGGCLVRHRPDGQVDRVITLPVRRPTCCAFGGPDLSTLYVTTTSQHMSDAERAAEPLAGALLALQVGCKGLPEPRFALQ